MSCNYQCTLCNTLFNCKQSYLVHRLKCGLKHNQNGSYKLLKVTLFDSVFNTKKDNAKMPNRSQHNVHTWQYHFLTVRDGEKCLLCGDLPTLKNPLEIDHADCNPGNEAPDNLHLLCKRCNLGLRKVKPSQHKAILSQHSAIKGGEREGEKGNFNTELAHSVIDYANGSPEMQASGYFEIKVREWFLTKVDQRLLEKQDAIYCCAEAIGCSPNTVIRYLCKLTCSDGVLKIKRDSYNRSIIVRRQPGPPIAPLSNKVEKQLKEIIK